MSGQSFFQIFFKAEGMKKNLYREVAQLLSAKGVDKMIGIGEAIVRQQQMFKLPAKFFASTDDFYAKAAFQISGWNHFCWKGARPFGFEKIGKCFSRKRMKQ